MPIYEYNCRHCQKSFEELVLSKTEVVKCPGCASENLERKPSLFSSPGGDAAKTAAGGGCGCTPQTCGCH